MRNLIKTFFFVEIAFLVVAGCTQISGLSEYSKADEIKDGTDGNDDDTTTASKDGTEGKNDYCSPGCEADMLTNGNCDEACRNLACGFDGGDCVDEFCVDGCLIGTIDDGVCNAPCNIDVCDFDGGDCHGEDVEGCPPGCQASMIGDNICDYICLGNDCGNDGGDCDDLAECSGGCQNVLLGDGKCDEACNNPECFMDNGDCMDMPGCNDNENVDCFQECVPCARVGACEGAMHICNENAQCRLLQDCLSVECADKKLEALKVQCTNDCFSANPDGVMDYQMLQQCLYCTVCPASCREEFGPFCDSFNG